MINLEQRTPIEKHMEQKHDGMVFEMLDLELQRLGHYPPEQAVQLVKQTHGYSVANRSFDIDESYLLQRVQQLRI